MAIFWLCVAYLVIGWLVSATVVKAKSKRSDENVVLGTFLWPLILVWLLLMWINDFVDETMNKIVARLRNPRNPIKEEKDDENDS